MWRGRPAPSWVGSGAVRAVRRGWGWRSRAQQHDRACTAACRRRAGVLRCGATAAARKERKGESPPRQPSWQSWVPRRDAPLAVPARPCLPACVRRTEGPEERRGYVGHVGQQRARGVEQPRQARAAAQLPSRVEVYQAAHAGGRRVGRPCRERLPWRHLAQGCGVARPRDWAGEGLMASIASHRCQCGRPQRAAAAAVWGTAHAGQRVLFGRPTGAGPGRRAAQQQHQHLQRAAPRGPGPRCVRLLLLVEERLGSGGHNPPLRLKELHRGHVVSAVCGRKRIAKPGGAGSRSGRRAPAPRTSSRLAIPPPLQRTTPAPKGGDHPGAPRAAQAAGSSAWPQTAIALLGAVGRLLCRGSSWTPNEESHEARVGPPPTRPPPTTTHQTA